MIIGMVLFPRFTILDVAGPYEVFARMPGAEVRLVATTKEPLRTDQGMVVHPDATFDTSQLDVLFVPGGPGQFERMEDERFLKFLKEQANHATWVSSVCTGALLLGAGGLLKGYRATTHWLSLPLLSLLGAEAVGERVVIDRNRITAAGVSAGIDLALVLAARLFDEKLAREIQLIIEYDPEPPFPGGSPGKADAAEVERVRASRRAFQDVRRAQIERITRAWV